MNMAGTISLSLTDAQATQVVTALCNNFNYAQNSGGLTQQQFALAQLTAWLKGQVDQSNQTIANAAAATAQASSLAGATTIPSGAITATYAP
jgi:ABC-type transporter Mla subunit MlaD